MSETVSAFDHALYVVNDCTKSVADYWRVEYAYQQQRGEEEQEFVQRYAQKGCEYE